MVRQHRTAHFKLNDTVEIFGSQEKQDPDQINIGFHGFDCTDEKTDVPARLISIIPYEEMKNKMNSSPMELGSSFPYCQPDHPFSKL